MARYLAMWKVDPAKIPVDMKERSDGWMLLMGAVQQDMNKGMTKDWGVFVGTVNGYSIVEGEDAEIHKAMQQYVPFVSFKLYPVLPYLEAAETIKALGR